MKQHRTTELNVIKSEYVKSDKVEVTYEDFSKKTMTSDDFKRMHKVVEK